MRFAESPAFTAKLQTVPGAEDAFRDLQVSLAQEPELGRVIPGCGGFRKVRMGFENQGKRGGARVIYLLLPVRPVIMFVLAFIKGEADNISSDGKKFLRHAAAEIQKHQDQIP